ncbi:MAG TPA: carboxypeptidase regulatory-like domain-containing protein [Gemmatimonadales bacterium]|jgi:hypothetical protein|nr:carboxypeptidase regulatory-like domain-containing protein [Gemmatimonadales bacterium]
MGSPFRSSFLTFGLTAALSVTAVAQVREPTGGIVGRVIDQQSRHPVGGARVALLGTARRSDSDTSGRFTQAGLASGTYLLEVRAIGYGVTSWVIRLGDGEVLDYVFELAPLGYELDPVVVEAHPTFAQRRMQEFELRRRGGRGAFITEAQIKTSKAATLVELLRNVSGVRVSCRSGGCVVRMTRAARGECVPDWVVDGFPATQSATPHLPTIGVVAIEIYRSPSETPAEFLKSDSQCGVIAIWTKSGP